MSGNPTIFDVALDPWLVGLYLVAWIGVIGALAPLWTALSFWRNRGSSRWLRIHHTMIAASGVMIAWFFVVFRIAGTTLNY